MIELVDLSDTPEKGVVLARWPTGEFMLRILHHDRDSLESVFWFAKGLNKYGEAVKQVRLSIETDEPGPVVVGNNGWQTRMRDENEDRRDRGAHTHTRATCQALTWWSRLTTPEPYHMYTTPSKSHGEREGELLFDPSPWLLLGEMPPHLWGPIRFREWVETQLGPVTP